MKKVNDYELTASEVHDALFAAGFTPLVHIKFAAHWTRRDRVVIVHHELEVESTPVEKNVVKQVLYADFVRLENGEIILS